MKILNVNIPGREYNIYIGSGLIEKTGEIVSGFFKGNRIAVITDTNVGPLYAERVVNALNGYDVSVITVDAGEKSKSLETLQYVYTKLLEVGVTRTDLIIALGGGVVGDLTGFASATYLRGVDFIQIPTTLLAQVDSSVGGKTAVNLPQGKNLVGSFCQPKAVIADTDTLRTLSDEILSDGMAEVIKYGAICDAELFSLLSNIKNKEELFAKIAEIVYTCCSIKSKIVEEDEFDTGKRMILNFGHTFGHAIEKKYNFSSVTHGMAVAAGMVMAAAWGEKHNVTPNGTVEKIEAVLRNYNLPTAFDITREELLASAGVDKKSDGSMINLILLRSIGDAAIYKIDRQNI